MNDIDPLDLIDRLPRHHSEVVAQLIEERDYGRRLTKRLLDTLARIKEATGTERYELEQLPDILVQSEAGCLHYHHEKEEMTKHTHSIEILVHYRCGKCDHWWAIGDGPTDGVIWCPRCGQQGWTMVQKENI